MSCGIADGYKILRRESYTDKIGRHTVRDEMSTCAAELLATAAVPAPDVYRVSATQGVR